MATPGSASSTYQSITNEEDILQGTAIGTSISISCDPGATNAALVRIPKIHKDGIKYLLDIGEEKTFRAGTDDISSCFIQGDGGATSVKWTLVAVGAMR